MLHKVGSVFAKQKRFVRMINRNIHKDGNVVILEATGMPVFDPNGDLLGYRGVYRDITERINAEEALKESRDYLHKIINSVADPIFVKDREHRWVLLNDAHSEMFGIPNEELIGKSDYDYFPKEQAAVFWEKDEFVFESEKENINEERWTDSRGVTHTIITKKNLYIDSQGKKFIVGIIRDITKRKKAEERLREAMEMKSKFTSVVSHELRTPLSAIKTGINLVLDGLAGDISDDQRNFLDIAKRNVDRLARLVNDILDFQKLESGKVSFNFEENDINAVVNDVYGAMRSLVEGKTLTFCLDLAKDLPKIKLDRDKIVQVLSNLVNNAVKFTEKGRVTISTLKRDKIIEVSVKDTGIGIRKKDMRKLFHSFEQIESFPGEKKVDGTGLGLAICREIIEKHQGNIWAESKFARGSVFYFSLPIG